MYDIHNALKDTDNKPICFVGRKDGLACSHIIKSNKGELTYLIKCYTDLIGKSLVLVRDFIKLIDPSKVYLNKKSDNISFRIQES